jgi:prefoldin subunit 5
MERIRNVEDARERLTKRLDYYTSRLEAWEKVARVCKKDGKDFAILSKNFENCTFKTEYNSNYVVVYLHTNSEGYTRDEINISGNAYGVEACDTADKIEKRIAERIALYKGYINSTKKGLETIGEQMEAIAPELETLKNAIAKAQETDCNYILGSYIKEYLSIL